MSWNKKILRLFIAFGAALALICNAADKTEIRAARSVHLSYPVPDGVLFYNEVVVEKSVNCAYFMACGWNTGYFGIQQLENAEDKIVLFSVWDPVKGDDPSVTPKEDRVEVTYQSPDSRVKRFGGEGTGGQCIWRYNWLIGETNRFIISARVEDQKTEYTAWFRTRREWKKLAGFRTRTGGKPLSGYYSFIEDFRRDGKSAQEERRARFLNGWVKSTHGDWVSLNRARFTASNAEWESKENIDAGHSADSFYLATGGDLKMSRELRTLITLDAMSSEPTKVWHGLPLELSREGNGAE